MVGLYAPRRPGLHAPCNADSNAPARPRGLAKRRKDRPGWDRGLQFFLANAEHLVVVVHDATANTSLPFVHTARRYCRHDSASRDWRDSLYGRPKST